MSNMSKITCVRNSESNFQSIGLYGYKFQHDTAVKCRGNYLTFKKTLNFQELGRLSKQTFLQVIANV